MRTLALLLLAGTAAVPDTFGRSRSESETHWKKGDWIVATNDSVAALIEEGDVVALQLVGDGESVMLRRRRYPLSFPKRVNFRIRWTAAQAGSGYAYPSVNLVFNPPDVGDPWWKKPLVGAPGAAAWNNELTSFVFHFATDDAWKQYGMASQIESASKRHTYASPKDKWVELELRLERKGITVFADGVEVARETASLESYMTFALAFGDQANTRVELDAITIR